MKKPRFTQISTLFLIIIAVIIAITFVTVNIGKVALDKTYSSNAADAGALSAASVMAYAFNYVANANAGDDKSLKTNWDAIKDDYTKHFNHAQSTIKPEFDADAQSAISQFCWICGGCSSIRDTAKTFAEKASTDANRYSDQMDELLKDGFHEASSDEDQKGQDYGVVPNGASLQQAELEAIRERVHDDQDGQNDLYQNALSTGYLFNFSNSGISHRLGKENQKRYSAFLQELTPEKVRNGQPETFTWIDGAARVHTVTAIIMIEPARTYKLETTQDDRSEDNQKLDEARREAANARANAGNTPQDSPRTGASSTPGMNAANIYASAAPCCDCTKPCLFPCDISGFAPLCCPEKDASGDAVMNTAQTFMTNADTQATQAKSGLDGQKQETTSNKDGSEPYIIKKIVDIEHDRQVQSSNFQFHMGGPIKGMRGDVDIPTVYPPVASTAVASFKGNGDIENGQASHDAKLISAN